MNKSDGSKTRYCLQWENHPKHGFKSICSLMEHQSLVDIAICCGNHTLHAHKCILAASSPYFKEELEKNSSIEQVLIFGFDYCVMKSIIEFMYCGETIIAEEHLKYLIAAAKLFQLRGLEALFAERQDFQNPADEVYIPPPQFLTKKPKYPSAPHPFGNAPMPSNNVLKPINFNSMNDPYNQRRFKRKYIRAEAEKACAKEAQASRMALANLQKEIASTPQVNSFIIEESCTETTVENFIPHSDENYVDNLNDLHQVQVVDYTDIEDHSNDTKPPNMIQFTMQNATNGMQGLTADKIKHILGNGVQSNVEIMFKTSEGNFVTVTDEVLQNLSKGGLQYQVVDENGQVGEIRDLQVLDRTPVEKVEDIQVDEVSETPVDIPVNNTGRYNPQNSTKTIPDHYINTNYLGSEVIPNGSDSVIESPIELPCDKEERNPLESFNNDISYENSFNIQNSVIFGNRNSTDDSEFEEKQIEFVPMNSEEYICTSVSQESSDEIPNPINTIAANNYYNLSDTILNENDFMSSITNNTSTNEENSADNSMDRTEDEVSPKKTKFSPDIFFADLPNGNSTSTIISEDLNSN